MLRLALASLLLAACTVSPAGGPCARHSDCATGYCSAGGTCSTAPVDAGTDDGPDASTTIPPLDGDPTIDAPEETPADAPPDDGL